MKLTHLILGIGLLSTPLQADTIGEESKIVINRINATDYEVIRGQGMGPNEIWCGAASYIIRRQGQSDRTSIYLKRVLGPSVTASGQKGAVFSTSNAGLPTVSANRFTVQKVGTSFRASRALRECRDAFTRSTK